MEGLLVSDLDLFGEPIDPRRGFGQTAIAIAIGITVPTLLRHYAGELGSRAAIGRQYHQPEEKDYG
jgi:hypothetical protein